jgi:hypothetical protein
MVWSVDRLGRSLQDLVSFLNHIHAVGVDLFLHQQGIDTTTAGGKAMFQMLGVFSEFESLSFKSGFALALGGPKLEKRILAALKAPGRTEGVRKIAKRFGVDPSTVQRISRPFEAANVVAA